MFQAHISGSLAESLNQDWIMAWNAALPTIWTEGSNQGTEREENERRNCKGAHALKYGPENE